MIKFIKRQWLRLKQSWLAFKREWRFNKHDFYNQEFFEPAFRIKPLSFLKYKNECDFLGENLELKPPYYGQTIMRFDGHAFPLRYKHYNKETGQVRYLETDKPADGFVVQSIEILDQLTLEQLKHESPRSF